MARLSVLFAYRTSTLLLLARLFGAGVGFATQLFLARVMSVEGLGLFFFVMSMSVVTGVVIALGYPAIATRFISRYQLRGHFGAVHGFVRRARYDVGLAASAACAGIVAYAVMLDGSSARLALICGALAVPGVAFIRLNGSIAAALSHFNLSFLPDLLIRPLLFLAIIAGMVILAGPLTPNGALLAFALSALIVAGIQHVLLASYLPVLDDAVVKDRRLTALWRRTGLPLIVLAAYTSLFADCAIGVTGLLLPKAELAVFGVCLKLAFLVGFSVQALHEYSGPELVALLERKEFAKLEQVLNRILLASVVTTGIALAGTAALGSLVLRAFGDEFVAGSGALVLLVGVQVIRAAAGPAVLMLIAAGAQRAVAVIVVASLFVLVLSAAMLVPALGISGATAAVVLTTLFSSLAFGVVLYRQTGLHSDISVSARFGLELLRRRATAFKRP